MAFLAHTSKPAEHIERLTDAAGAALIWINRVRRIVTAGAISGILLCIKAIEQGYTRNRGRNAGTDRRPSGCLPYMADSHALTSLEIREIGEVLFGLPWQSEMARAIGVPRQSIGHYLNSGGAKGAQSAAIIGLVARLAVRELLAADEQQLAVDARHAALIQLVRRFDPG